jgi:hypothetical protein
MVMVQALGCAKPTFFPDPPQAEWYADGHTHLAFDVDGDNRIDYLQTYRGGTKRLFSLSQAHSQEAREVVDWDLLNPADERHLFLLLDGVPYDLIAELWGEGRFRLFHRPGLVISPLPSLTDVSFAKLLGAPRPPGYESAYFSRCHNRLTNGSQTYLRGANEPWRSALDYRLSFIEDAIMYIFPAYVFRRELENARRALLRSDSPHPVLYILSTDGLGHMLKRSQVLAYLRLLDRWIERIVYEHGARLQVTVLADHGNSFVPTRPLALSAAFKKAGLRAGRSLRAPGDVVLPQFGLIDFAAVYVFDDDTRTRVVETCNALEGVELVCYRQQAPDRVVVIHRNQQAVIRRAEAPPAYSYEMVSGDPLELAPMLESLTRAGLLDEKGFAPDSAWLQQTAEHVFPDPLHRIWEALHDNTDNPADVLLSLAPGWHVGDPSLDAWVKMEGTHGGLRDRSSNTFIMSTAFEVPAYLRPSEVPALVRRTIPWKPRVGQN